MSLDCCALKEAFSMENVHPEAAEGDSTGKALEVAASQMAYYS